MLTATNLATAIPWEILETVTMTNTFRILPLQSIDAAERFFKATPHLK